MQAQDGDAGSDDVDAWFLICLYVYTYIYMYIVIYIYISMFVLFCIYSLSFICLDICNKYEQIINDI